VAVLRNARGGVLPDVLDAARVVVASGCGGLTVHPRPDRRHIHPEDVASLAAALAAGQLDRPGGAGVPEFNIEGNPLAGARSGYPGFIELVLAARPTQVTLVPDSDQQLTSDHGWDLAGQHAVLEPLVARLRDAGCRVSLFMDSGCLDFAAVAAMGAQRVELYTGPYAQAFAAGAPQQELARCARAAERAQAAGLAVNAGHDLDQRNLGPLLRAAPAISEVSIGHALFCEALYDGLATTVQRYLAIIDEVG